MPVSINNKIRNDVTRIPESLAPVLYILSKLNEESKLYLSKILFYADMYHIKEYGRPITEDNYIAMDFGPVPSLIYDYFKSVANDKKSQLSTEVATTLKRYLAYKEPNLLIPLQAPDLAFLSKSAIKSLDQAIDFKIKTGRAISNLSHGLAWENGRHTPKYKMKFQDIAVQAGVNEEMLEYIRENV